jgi:hypothetical protein
VEIRVEIR